MVPILIFSFFNKLINLFKKNVQHHDLYRDTKLLKIKEPPTQLLDTLQKDFNIILNYGQIVHWPEGSFMDRHYDGHVAKDNNFTAICYLNDNFKGGETVVEKTVIKPKQGLMILFSGDKKTHSVNKIKKGTRYTIPCWYTN